MTNYKDIYNKIKELEEIFDIPTPSVTIIMGVFDASAGSFQGKTSSIHYESLADMYPKGRPIPTPAPRYTDGLKVETFIKGNRVEIKTTHAPKVDAVDVLLEFNARNVSSDGFTVITNGIKQTSFKEKIMVNVKNARKVTWKIQSGNIFYEDVIEIRRFPIIGGGAFTIPVLPISIIYEPPPDSEGRNKAAYFETEGMCNATEIVFSEEASETRPVKVEIPGFPGAEEFKGILKGIDFTGKEILIPLVKKYYEKMSPEELKEKFGEGFDLGKEISKMEKIFDYFKKIAEAINWAFGTASGRVTEGRSKQHSTKVLVCNEIGQGLDTGKNDGGPGIGDIMYYWSNVKLAWLAFDGPVQLVLLGYERKCLATAGDIKRNLNNVRWLTDNGLSADSAKALLSINPFVNNPMGVPPSERFEEDGAEINMACGGSDFPYSCHRVWKETRISRTAKSSFRTEIKEYRKGFFSFLGIGPQEDKTIRLHTMQTSAAEVRETEEVRITAELWCGKDDAPYCVQIYKDHIFRTFAFRKIMPRDKPIVSGRALSMTGKPIVRHVVTLKSHGKEYTTITNNEGDFAFYSPNIRRGTAFLIAGDASTEFFLTPERPVLNLRLELKYYTDGIIPKIYSSGSVDIPQTWTLDLDEGKLKAGSEADIFFGAETADRRYVIPINGAKIAKVGMSSVGRDACAAANLSTSRISISSLPAGSYVCVLTNRGRYSQFRVNAPVGPSPGVLKIEYITWE